MPDAPSTPSHDDLVAELKVVREKGVIRLRALSLPALQAAARASGESGSEHHDPPAIEALLRNAVARLGGDTIGEAAEYLFGLVRGSMGWKPKDLRERAASFYNITSESFRKEPERLIIHRIAEEILLLCRAQEADGLAHGLTRGPAPAPVISEVVADVRRPDEISALRLGRLGSRRTAYPLDMSLRELHQNGLFVPSRLTRYHERSTRLQRGSVETILSAVRQRNSVLILGEPGSGKSLTLYEVAVACANAGLAPIPVRASEALDFLAGEEWQALADSSDRRIVILLDGLDEALELAQQASSYAIMLGEYVRRFPTVVTSRLREFEENMILDITDVGLDELYVLQPWTVETEFQEYLRRLTDAALIEEPSLYSAVIASEQLAALVSRPLYARMLTFIGGDGAHAIAQPVLLYGEYLSKLASVADAMLRSQTCGIRGGALSLWQEAAWLVYKSSAVSMADSVNGQEVERGLSAFGERVCVRRGLNHIIDRRHVLNKEIWEFLHYSFFEYLVAKRVCDGLLDGPGLSEITELLRHDLSREIRHYLTAQLRLVRDEQLVEILVGAYLSVRAENDFGSKDQLRVGNLVSYLLSRTADSAVEVLHSLLDGESNRFLRNGLLGGLCHRGSASGLEVFIRELEEDEECRSQARGYTLYYYGDMRGEAGPPYQDLPPYGPYRRSYYLVMNMIAESDYEETVTPERRFFDIYSLVDIVAVRAERMAERDVEILRDRLAVLRETAVPKHMIDMLDGMIAEVSP